MSDMPGWISSLSDAEARQVSSDLSQVMSSAAERVHYAESRRSNFAAIAAGLFAGAIALASMAVHEGFQAARWALSVLAIGFFLLSLFLFYVYSKQVNRYPWTSATTTWKWFYRDALPREANFNHSFVKWLFRWSEEVTRAKSEFAAQLPGFAEKVRTVRDERESLWQDVQQLYVLHVNEKYKNAYLSRLRSILSAGLATILVAAVVAAMIQNFVLESNFGANSRASSTPIRLSWVKYEGVACVKDCWLLNIQASNHSSKTMSIRIEGVGVRCLELPGSAALNPVVIKPHATQMVFTYLACGASSPADLKPRVINDAK